MAFHSYKIELYGKNSNGSYKTVPVDLSEIISISLSFKLGTSADGFSLSFVNYNDLLFEQIKIDDKIKVYGTLNGTTYVLLFDGLVNEKTNNGGLNNKLINITGLNLLEKFFNSLVSTTGETVQRIASYWVTNIIQQVNGFNSLGNTNRTIYYTTTPGSTDPKDPLGRVYTDATINQTTTNIEFTRSLEKAFKLIEELSAEKFTSNGQYYFYLDEYNYFHWKPKPTIIDSELNWGDEIVSHRTKKGMYDVINYIIMNCGKSPYGANILNFDYRVESINKYGWKVKLLTKESISGNMMTEERKKVNAWTDGESFPDDYDYVTSWGDTVSKDSEYNTSFVEQAWSVSNDLMDGIFDSTTGASYKVDLVVTPSLGFSLGTLNGLVIPGNGWNTPYNIRLDSYNLKFGEEGWSTDLKFKEDTELTSL